MITPTMNTKVVSRHEMRFEGPVFNAREIGDMLTQATQHNTELGGGNWDDAFHVRCDEEGITFYWDREVSDE